MQANTQLQNKMFGRPKIVEPNSFFASHPGLQLCNTSNPRGIHHPVGNKLGKVDYMEILNSMIYGGDPEQGAVGAGILSTRSYDFGFQYLMDTAHQQPTLQIASGGSHDPTQSDSKLQRRYG